jgi:hypothetical protein
VVGYYQNIDQIKAVVNGFELCTTGKDDFPHRSHLTVAVYYLLASNEAEATDKIRSGLIRFLDHHGVGRAKFHETLTVFWMKAISALVRRLDSELKLHEVTNTVIESLGNSRLVFDYYSEELLWSDEARKNWVFPDLKHLGSETTQLASSQINISN